MNLNTIKGIFFKNLFIIGFVLIVIGCKKELEDTKPVEGGAKLVFTVKGINNELSKVNNKITSVSSLSSVNIENVEPQVEAFSKQVSLVSQSINKGRPSSFESSNQLVSEKKLSKMAGVIPVDHDIRYRLLLFDSETNDLVANVEAKVNQALTINVTAGRSYYWRAYSHNSKEVMAPLNVSNSNPSIESSIDKDLFWDASVTPITASTLTDSLGIVFDYKVAEFVINLDTEGLYGDISDLSMEFGSDSYFKKGILDLKTGLISSPTIVSRTELNLSDFKAAPESKVLQAKFYTVDPSNITDFTLKVKKVTVNQDNNILNEIHKSTDPVKDVNFSFIPSLSKSHVASMAFRYTIPTKKILHVTGIGNNDYQKFSFAAQPYIAPNYVNPVGDRAPHSMLKQSLNYGTSPNSLVYTNGFTHELILDSGLKTALEQVDKPDIVIMTLYYTMTDDDVSALSTYLDGGGVIIMFVDFATGIAAELASRTKFINAAFGLTNTITLTQSPYYGAGSLFQLDHERTINDKIINGPFGNLSGQYWGQDTHNALIAANLPVGTASNQATVYSDPQAANVNNAPTGHVMFKHNSKSLFWIGNSSFLSTNAGSTTGGWTNSDIAEPFATVNIAGAQLNNSDPNRNYDYYPMPKRYGYTANGVGYNATPYTMVYNAPLFANLMTWALYQSEFFGINSGGN